MLSRFAILKFLGLLLLIGVVGLQAEEEIRVELATQAQLSSLYLSNIEAQDPFFSKEYLKSLHKTIYFDLQHSGYSKVLEKDENLENILLQSQIHTSFQAEKWRKVGAVFVLKALVKEQKLDLFIFNVKTGSLKHFEGIPLTGDLPSDRVQMHKLADAVIKTIFGVEGIAHSHILFSVQAPQGDAQGRLWRSEIWQCDWDGDNQKQLTFEQSYSITPTFLSLDPKSESEKYLYVSYKSGQPKIYLSTLKSRMGKPILELRGNQLLPAVSKQGNLLAFISDAAGRPDLFIQQIEGNGQMMGKPKQLFSFPRATQASPTFSPDGSKIAFVSDKDGTPRIYILPVSLEQNKRAQPLLITKYNRENTCPNWSPDGKKIAYSAKTNDVRQIWIYDLATEEERQLTTGPGNKENPCWAANSLHLVFNSTDPDSSELYLVNLNQPEAVKITQGAGKKHYPTWGTR